MRSWVAVPLFCVSLVLVRVPSARAAVITFDDLADATVVGGVYGGVTLTHATALTAGISLNEFEFPPVSGTTVAFDDGGPMRIEFSTPVISVGGFFTYAAPLLFQAFSSTDTLLGAVSSGYSANLGLSGDVGSLPNELLGLAAGGIAYVVITGDNAGSSFTLDDFTYETGVQLVPEPTTLALLVAGLCGFAVRRLR